MQIKDLLRLLKELTPEELAETIVQLYGFADVINKNPGILLDLNQKILPSTVTQLLVGLNELEIHVVTTERQKSKRADLVGVEEVTQAWVDQISPDTFTTPADFHAHVSPDSYSKLEMLFDCFSHILTADVAIMQYLAPLKKMIAALRFRFLEQEGVDKKFDEIERLTQQQVQAKREAYYYDLYLLALVECNKNSGELARTIAQLKVQSIQANEENARDQAACETAESAIYAFQKRVGELCEQIQDQEQLIEAIKMHDEEKQQLSFAYRDATSRQQTSLDRLNKLKCQLAEMEAQYQPFLEIRKKHADDLEQINRKIDLEGVIRSGKIQRDELAQILEERDSLAREQLESAVDSLFAGIFARQLQKLLMLCQGYQETLFKLLESDKYHDEWLKRIILSSEVSAKPGEDLNLLIATLLTDPELKPENVEPNLRVAFQKYRILCHLSSQLAMTQQKYAMRAQDVFDREMLELLRADLQYFKTELNEAEPVLIKVRDEGVTQSVKSVLNTITFFAAKDMISPKAKGYDFYQEATQKIRSMIQAIDGIVTHKMLNLQQGRAMSSRPL